MTTPRAWADDEAPRALEGAALLERAVGYTRTSLQLVASTPLSAPTPCSRWDLHALLRHMNDSLAALTEAADIGYVDLVPIHGLGATSDPARVLVERLKGRACALLSAWAHHPETVPVAVADRVLRSDLLAAAGSLEIAVHGWDVAQACGVDRPIPAPLALDLLEVVPMFVGEDDRPGRFAPAVEVRLHARPSTRLLAALGRRTP
jgi:uncharacterized protein (TIGR03086 family)